MDARADMARELTADEAKALFDAGWWKKMDAPEAARLQRVPRRDGKAPWAPGVHP